MFCYADWKSLHIPIAIPKLRGLNLFICIYIISGGRRTIKCSSNQNVMSEHFIRLLYQSVKYIFAYLCTHYLRWHDASSASSSENERRYYCNTMHIMYYCNIILCNCFFSAVNETWGNLTALHLILHQHCLSLYRRLVSSLTEHVHVFWRRRGFAKCREDGDLSFQS